DLAPEDEPGVVGEGLDAGRVVGVEVREDDAGDVRGVDGEAGVLARLAEHLEDGVWAIDEQELAVELEGHARRVVVLGEGIADAERNEPHLPVLTREGRYSESPGCNSANVLSVQVDVLKWQFIAASVGAHGLALAVIARVPVSKPTVLPFAAP